MKSLFCTLAALALYLPIAARAGELVDVNVIDRDSGSVLPLHRHHGKLYIAGMPGHRYAVRLINRTGRRVLAVLSVDGVNAVTGETANPMQSGYVLDPWQSTEVDGWRKNLSEVAQFNFTSLGDSYAARTGRPNNVGVIGVAVFREKYRPIIREQLSARDSAQAEPAPYAGAAEATRQAAKAAPRARAAEGVLAPLPVPGTPLGTGHGAREASYASYTAFERASAQPDEVDSIWYDSYRNLLARGVIRLPRPLAVEPQPFPPHFVPDPS